MTPAEQLAAARAAVDAIRAQRGLEPGAPLPHRTPAVDEPDQSPTDPADRLGPDCP